MTGAHWHDVTQLEAVVDGVKIKRRAPTKRRSKHLCVDAAYTSAKARDVIEKNGYIAYVMGRGKVAKELKIDPSTRVRRWVVEVAHSWFNRFRKLLVRYEKLN